MLYHLI